MIDGFAREIPEEPKIDNPMREPTREEMPEWWDPNRPPQRLKPGYIYRGKDGRWYHVDGTTVNRAERRRAGVSHGK